MLARDGVTAAQGYPVAFAMEWQVREDEPKLFQATRTPQHPLGLCVMPQDKQKEKGRRLGAVSVSEKAARAACAKRGDEIDECTWGVPHRD